MKPYSSRHAVLLLACVSSLALTGCPAATTGKSGKESSLSTAIASAAKDAANSGDQQQSLMFTQRLYKQDPNNADYIVNYAKDLRRAGRVEDAKLVIRTPALGKRADAKMLTEAAMVLVSAGEYDEAMSFAQKALEKNGKSPDAHHALALAMSGLEEHAGAQLQFQKALDLWPEGRDQTPILNNLAMSMAAQGKISDAKLIMSMATGEALTSRTYQTNRALLGTLEDKEVKVEKVPIDAPDSGDHIKIEKPADSVKNKQPKAKGGKMEPIVEYRGIKLDRPAIQLASNDLV